MTEMMNPQPVNPEHKKALAGLFNKQPEPALTLPELNTKTGQQQQHALEGLKIRPPSFKNLPPLNKPRALEEHLKGLTNSSVS